ncbi:MAG: polysaccharide pyruvyl transferase family protein, partial [Clostridia bacterium]|nr:polysaccharide pyruvyl transferase family protein [Clostridia bacterium]
MKIGILTFPHAPSLGAMLQMRALYHALESMGHDVEIVNYESPNVIHKKKRKKNAKGMVITVLSKCFIKSSAPSFREFEAPLKMFPEMPSFDQEALDAIADRFDRIIVGSDQVWNPVVTGYDKNFYLEFCSDPAKKASYAASFGYAQIEEHDQKRVGELLNEFSYLSVREKDGAE